jgi:ParB family chromosome partitioning protein
MQVHPAAQMFPLMDGGEFEALAADIATNGLQELIVLDTDGAILDGRNRFRACEAAGVTPEFRVYEGDDPVGFVVSANIHRRHLSETQRAMIAARLATLRDGVRRDRQGAQICAPTQSEAAELLRVSRRGVQHARQVIDHGIPDLVDAVDRSDIAVSTAAQIAKQEPEQQREAIRTAHVSYNGGNSEWYTPAEYIKAAREVMGEIDLDPASCETANEVVGATGFYTEEDDGLEQEWRGRVWMNPPYSQPAIERFCVKLAQSYRDGLVTEACVLVNNATETAWFQTLASAASAVCFPKGRVKFWNPEREAVPLQGQAVLYLGRFPSVFMETFGGFGFAARLESE